MPPTDGECARPKTVNFQLRILGFKSSRVNPSSEFAARAYRRALQADEKAQPPQL
jgi:hypothetical protein